MKKENKKSKNNDLIIFAPYKSTLFLYLLGFILFLIMAVYVTLFSEVLKTQNIDFLSAMGLILFWAFPILFSFVILNSKNYYLDKTQLKVISVYGKLFHKDKIIKLNEVKNIFIKNVPYSPQVSSGLGLPNISHSKYSLRLNFLMKNKKTFNINLTSRLGFSLLESYSNTKQFIDTLLNNPYLKQKIIYAN